MHFWLMLLFASFYCVIFFFFWRGDGVHLWFQRWGTWDMLRFRKPPSRTRYFCLAWFSILRARHSIRYSTLLSMDMGWSHSGCIKINRLMLHGWKSLALRSTYSSTMPISAWPCSRIRCSSEHCAYHFSRYSSLLYATLLGLRFIWRYITPPLLPSPFLLSSHTHSFSLH
jgi:hypothetical protein